MRIEFGGNKKYDYRPWRPADGRVLSRISSFDCETTTIDDERPWLTPTFVLGAAFDGEHGHFVTREHVAAFLRAHWNIPLVMHNAAFDLDVLAKECPKLDVYAAVEDDRISDTFLLHKLYALATRGDPAAGKDEATLETCAEEYLGVALPKDIRDGKGREVRLSYDTWLGRPPTEMEPVYLEYLAKDVIATRQVYWKLYKLIRGLLRQSQSEWGFVSPGWQAECLRKWGLLTHGIQLRAAVALRAITANGMRIDVEHRDRLVPVLEAERDRLRALLRKQGYLAAGEGSVKSLQAVFNRLEMRHPGVAFPRTEGGSYATSAEALYDLAGLDPFVADLMAYRAVDKLLSSFLDKLGRRKVHSSFNVLARTGRTSSFGALNAQNLPKDERVRACFVPSRGHVFIDADYKTIELAALAQACRAQFGLESEMARQINAGRDLPRCR